MLVIRFAAGRCLGGGERQIPVGRYFKAKWNLVNSFFSDACHLHLYTCVCVFCICVCILYLYLRIFQYWEGGISRQSGSWSVAFSSVCNLLRRVNKQMLLPSLAILAYLQPPIYLLLKSSWVCSFVRKIVQFCESINGSLVVVNFAIILKFEGRRTKL